jgi:hypothetical protein
MTSTERKHIEWSKLVNPRDPCGGLLELPVPKPIVYKVDWVRVEVMLNPNIPYENSPKNELCMTIE